MEGALQYQIAIRLKQTGRRLLGLVLGLVLVAGYAASPAAGDAMRTILMHVTEVGACTTGPPQPLGVDGTFRVPGPWASERFKPNFTTYKCDSTQVLLLPRGARTSCPVISAFVDGFRNTLKQSIRQFETLGGTHITRSGSLPALAGARGGWAVTFTKKLGTAVTGIYQSPDGREFYQLLLVPGAPGCGAKRNRVALEEAVALAKTFRIAYTNAGPRETP